MCIEALDDNVAIPGAVNRKAKCEVVFNICFFFISVFCPFKYKVSSQSLFLIGDLKNPRKVIKGQTLVITMELAMLLKLAMDSREAVTDRFYTALN